MKLNMKMTRCKKEGSKMKAFINMTLDNLFDIKGFGLWENEEGKRGLLYPSKPINYNGQTKYDQMVIPTLAGRKLMESAFESISELYDSMVKNGLSIVEKEIDVTSKKMEIENEIPYEEYEDYMDEEITR